MIKTKNHYTYNIQMLKWIEKGDISKSSEAFIKHYDENSNKGYIFEAD